VEVLGERGELFPVGRPLEGWAGARRRGWNELDWLEQPRTLGAAIAPLIGAGPDDVRVADSTSLNQYKLLRHALALAAPRRVIVVERDVFPSNRYVAEGIAHAGLAELRFIDGAAGLPDALAPGDVAVVALFIAFSTVFRPPRPWLLVPVLPAAAGFAAFCLADLARARQVRYLPKWGWAIACLIQIPLGGIMYLAAGKVPAARPGPPARP